MVQTVVIRKAESSATVTFGADELMSNGFDMTMNEGATAACSVTFGFDNVYRIPTSASFRWSDGSSRAIRKGDYYLVKDDNVTRFYGRISSVKPDGHICTIEAIDTVYQLKGIGQTYIRDHYSTYEEITRILYEADESRVIMGIPQDVTVFRNIKVLGKDTQDMNFGTWAVRDFKGDIYATLDSGDDERNGMRRYWVKLMIPQEASLASIQELTIKCWYTRYETSVFGTRHMRTDINVYDVNGNQIMNGQNYNDLLSGDTDGFIDGSRYWSWEASAVLTDQNNYLKPYTEYYMSVDISFVESSYVVGEYIGTVGIWGEGNRNLDQNIYSVRTQQWDGTEDWDVQWSEMLASEMFDFPNDVFPSFVLNYAKWYDVDDYTLIGEDTDPEGEEVVFYYLNSAVTLGNITPDNVVLGSTPMGGLVSVYSGDMSKMEIASDILEANGVAFTQNTSMSKRFTFFRCSGAFLSDYLKVLVDAINDNGKNNSMTTNLDTGAIVFGSRNSLYQDVPTKTLNIGTDPIITFTPSKNLSWKSVTGVVKGAESLLLGDANVKLPIMLCVTDVASLKEQGGLNNSKLTSGGGQSVLDMALSVYSELASNVSKDWTANVKLSGIDYSFMETNPGAADVGSGKIVSVTVPTLDIISYKMLVQSVSYDYVSHTTTLILNSFPVEYMNKVIDNENMIVVTSNTMFDISGDNEVLQQFYHIFDNYSQVTSVTDAVIKYTYNGSTINSNADKIYVNEMPNIKATLVTAVFLAKDKSIDEHGVIGFTVTSNAGTMDYDINEVERPDWYSSQNVIINALFYYGD